MTEVRIPEVGESVQDAVLAEWFKTDGDLVAKDEALFLLETDKITLEVVAEHAGVLRIAVQGGETVDIDQVVGTIEEREGGAPEPPAQNPTGEPVIEPVPAPSPSAAEQAPQTPAKPETPLSPDGEAVMAPSVRRLVVEHGLDPSGIVGSGPDGRLTKTDVLLHLEARVSAPEGGGTPAPVSGGDEDRVTREKMTPIRKRIAERLLEAQHGTAMLTTFNEVDMSRAMALRKRYKEVFRERHGVGLGLTSLFVKAATQALAEFPRLNASIDGDEMVSHQRVHMGIAVGSGRGLVVPVIRSADRLPLAGVEAAIAGFVEKIGANRLELSDLEGGTFTITNGGVYGSLMSTPILNPPQSGILALHKVEDRPVALDGRVVVHPMMYVALSYDHRLVDGREAVQFLVRVKQRVEDPDRLLLEV